jgi:pimeloyl-ACP methyl ester carboxylesterase
VPSPSGGPFEPVRANLPKADRDELARFLASYTSLDGAMAQDDAALAALNRGLFPFVSRALAARGVPAKALPLDPDPAGVGGWAVQAMLRSALLPHDWRAAMKAVDAPVLVVHGERDVAPIDASRLFAAAFRGARLVVLGGSSRYPQVEEPAIFAEQVALFLASPSVRAEDAPAGAVAAR